jgi:hypothetical protein
MNAQHSRHGSVERDYIVYLTEQRDGWTIELDAGGGAVRELSHYRDRATAVRSARAAVVTYEARLMVQWRGRVDLLEMADAATAVIAGEPPTDVRDF